MSHELGVGDTVLVHPREVTVQGGSGQGEIRRRESYELGPTRAQGLVDVLDRILDKGLVVAGDIRIHLADVELLTVQIRLLVCSVDKAQEIGLDWWRDHAFLNPDGSDEASSRREALEDMESKLDRLLERVEELEVTGKKPKGKKGTGKKGTGKKKK